MLRVVAFSVTSFLSAFLLFWLQLLFARLVLPQLGGAPAVWLTCLVFFPVVLVAAYGYVWTARCLGGQRFRLVAHALLVLLPLAVVPIQRVSAAPSSESNPVTWLLGLLCLNVGLPSFVLSSSSPLLQD